MRSISFSSSCLLSIAAASLVVSCGCRSTVRITGTPETGSQQLLLNNTVDRVICSVDFLPLADRTVYLDTTGLGDAADGYLTYRIREQMGVSGVRLAESRDDAEIVVEAGLAAYGTDSHNNVFGLTETDQLPELNLCVRDTQYGVSRLSMFAFERESGLLVWQAGPLRADACQRVSNVLGLGPFYSGTIQHPANRTQHCGSQHTMH